VHQFEKSRTQIVALSSELNRTLPGFAWMAPPGSLGYDRGMFRILVLFTISVALVSAQDEAAYSALMKATPPQVNAIRAAIMANDNAKVATEATKLADMFQQVSDFWTKKQKDDAVKMAQSARDAAKEIGAAKDADAQNAAVMKLQGTCGGCHRVYREGTAPNYKIKS
jgi:hypothetical protein